MATIYNIELTSHWLNFTEDEMKDILEKAIKGTKLTDNNFI